jgi:hypothetical protein
MKAKIKMSPALKKASQGTFLVFFTIIIIQIVNKVKKDIYNLKNPLNHLVPGIEAPTAPPKAHAPTDFQFTLPVLR